MPRVSTKGRRLQKKTHYGTKRKQALPFALAGVPASQPATDYLCSRVKKARKGGRRNRKKVFGSIKEKNLWPFYRTRSLLPPLQALLLLPYRAIPPLRSKIFIFINRLTKNFVI